MPEALVIQTAFLGDVVLTTPLFSALASGPTPYKTTALTTPLGAAILGHPGELVAGLSDVIVYDKKGADRGFGNFLKLGRELRRRRFDAVLSPHRSHRSAALAWMSRAPVRIGFDENALSFAWTHRVKRRRDIHDVERNLHIIDPLGGPPAGFIPKPEVAVTKEGGAGAARLLKGLPGGLRVGVAPGSVWGTKRWPPERFAAVIDLVAGERPASFVLIGGPGDVEAADGVSSIAKSKTLNLAGKTTIPEMVAVISKLDLFITNDTGPMHVAAALDVPIVAVFGATTPALGFAPYSEGAVVVEPPGTLDCRPCGAHGPQKCPKGHFRCMLDITPEMVREATLTLVDP